MWLMAEAGLGMAETGLPENAWVVLLYPGLMIWFHLLEQSGAGADPSPPTSG